MSRDDNAYYEQRAEAEIEMARQASTRQAVQAHYQLATYYLDRLYPDAEAAE